MDLLIIILWLLLGAAIIEMIYGIVKKTGILVFTGIVIAVMCALGLILAMGYADAVTITGEGILV